MSQILNVNQGYCHCRKSKYLEEQCTFKRKVDSFFCGRHINSKVKYIYQPVIDLNILDKKGLPIVIEQVIIPEYEDDMEESSVMDMMDEIVGLEENEKKKSKKTKKVVDKKKVYENRSEFFRDLLEDNVDLSVYTLRQSIRRLKFDSLLQTKKSRPQLIQDIRKIYELERYYNTHLDKISKIQKKFRVWSSERLKRCKNDTDILTFEDVHMIPKKYLYIMKDQKTQFEYAYDIRTLIHIFNTEKPTCPYTCREYDIMEKVRIMNYIEVLKRKNMDLEVEKIELTEKEKIEMRMKDIFYKINLLDNYTTHEWFKNLSIQQLYEFYRVAEDIWVYRIQLPMIEKRRYVKNGLAFQVSKNTLKSVTNIDIIRNYILNEIERFITEGNTRDDRKLGAMWMLTALVEVSPEAADALPHLVQFED